eukprot:TRINITY_DN67148_c3_g1_i1.p2 TRINITY_DN67148_c3_g1~~TRINITY_DN67148_c3_g1_i1.p2  ORF type:complete len:216 (+),score=29.20 TRINITY_DN67148_c3_g1_i1:1432-2079(+)
MAFRSSVSGSVSDYDYITRLVIIGDAGVGKSSLLLRFSDDVFDPSYIATIGVDFRICTLEKNDKIVKCQLWDTAGQERFKTITQSYYRGADGVAVCFDMTDRESFENCAKWLRDISMYSKEGTSKVLIGTKSDLVARRQISKQEAESFAEANGMKFIETSAKVGNAVDDPFHSLVDDIIKRKVESATNLATSQKGRIDIGKKVETKKKRGCFGLF